MECTSSRRPQPDIDELIAAYLELISEGDPARSWLAEGALEARPAEPWPSSGLAVASGPRDLIELRTRVEAVTGPGSWPKPLYDGQVLKSATEIIAVSSSALLMRIVRHLDALVSDNTGMWRTWPTVTGMLEPSIREIEQITVEAVLIDFGDQPPS